MTKTKTNSSRRFSNPAQGAYENTTAGKLAARAERSEKRGATRRAREERLAAMKAFAAMMA